MLSPGQLLKQDEELRRHPPVASERENLASVMYRVSATPVDVRYAVASRFAAFVRDEADFLLPKAQWVTKDHEETAVSA